MFLNNTSVFTSGQVYEAASHCRGHRCEKTKINKLTDSVKTKHAKIKCTALKTYNDDIHMSDVPCCLMRTYKRLHANTVVVIVQSRPQPRHVTSKVK